MKKLLLFVFFVLGCSANTMTNISTLVLDIFIIDDKCSDLIYKYDNLQLEKKKMIQEFEKIKNDDNITKEQKQDYEDRILDISFEINDVHQRWVECNGGVSTNYTP